MTADYATRDPQPTTRDPHRPPHFAMCRYCGQRISAPHCSSGRLSPTGDYCSQGCAEIANPKQSAEDVMADTANLRRIAAGVDARLPSIIMWLADGESQADVAKRLGVTQPTVHNLLNRLKASRATTIL